MRLTILLTTSLLVAAISAPAAEDKGGSDMIVFSVRQWEGEYKTDMGPATPFTSALYVVPADGSAPARKLLDVNGRGDAPVCSLDGEWIYFQAQEGGHHQIYRCRRDGTGVQNLTGSHQPPADRYGRALSRDGSLLAYVYHDGEIGRVAVMNSDGTEPRLIAPDIGYHYMAELSPDKRSVVFAHTARGYVLALKHLDSGELVTLTPDLPESFCPQFTPDGKTIVFFRRDGEIYRIDTDGSNLRRLTEGCKLEEFRLSATDKHGSSDPPSLSPDGQQLAFVARQGGVPQVHVMNLDGTGLRQVTTRLTVCGRARFSPDGRGIAFVSWEEDRPQVFVVPVNGGEARQLSHLVGAVHWIEWLPTRK